MESMRILPIREAYFLRFSAQLDREMPMRPYGEEWRAQRKILAQSFSHGMLPQYHHIQELEARRLVRGLLQNPDDVVSLAKT